MQIYTFGMYRQIKNVREESRKKTLSQNVVAAGDPAQEGYNGETETVLPETVSFDGKELNLNDFAIWTVDGYSMSPEDINNGDVLLCHPIASGLRGNIGYGKYVVIDVDPDYYAFKKKTLSFQKKLRKTLMKVSPDMDVETLMCELKKVDDSVLLPENKKRLREKFKEIKSYYKNEELMLSLTYRDGELRYSFHPVSLIAFVADYVLSKQKNNWVVSKL